MIILFTYTKLILLIDLEISILSVLKLSNTYYPTFCCSFSYDETWLSYRKRKTSFSKAALHRCSQVKISSRKYASNLQENTHAAKCVISINLLIATVLKSFYDQYKWILLLPGIITLFLSINDNSWKFSRIHNRFVGLKP